MPSLKQKDFWHIIPKKGKHANKHEQKIQQKRKGFAYHLLTPQGFEYENPEKQKWQEICGVKKSYVNTAWFPTF